MAEADNIGLVLGLLILGYFYFNRKKISNILYCMVPIAIKFSLTHGVPIDERILQGEREQ